MSRTNPLSVPTQNFDPTFNISGFKAKRNTVNGYLLPTEWATP